MDTPAGITYPLWNDFTNEFQPIFADNYNYSIFFYIQNSQINIPYVEDTNFEYCASRY